MRRLMLCVLALWISGCSSDTEDIFPQDGPTMSDIYNQALSGGGQGVEALSTPPRPADGGLVGADDVLAYTRTAENEIDNLFPRLENPDLVMFVFPHLTSGERLPVPGYATSFPLFERTEFALPGELAAPQKTARTSKIRILSGSSTPSAIRTY